MNNLCTATKQLLKQSLPGVLRSLSTSRPLPVASGSLEQTTINGLYFLFRKPRMTIFGDKRANQTFLRQ